MPDDLPNAPWITQASVAPDVASSLPDAPWAAPKPEAAPDRPMPGYLEALSQGVGAGLSGVGQTAQVVAGSSAPEAVPETSPAAQPYEWRDVLEPSRLAKKTLYGVGKGSPTIAGGVIGGAAGAATPIPGGALVGGALGAGAGSLLQSVGPVFAQELKRTPNDPDGAWDRAVKMSGIESAASALSWGTFKLGAGAMGPLKQIAFQALGVQPAIGVAAKAAENVAEGEAPTSGLGQAYAQSAVGTAIPAVGHMALTKPGGGRGLQPLDQRTAAQQNIYQSAQQKFLNADMLDQAATQPGLTSDQVYNMRLQAEMTRQDAKHETFLSNIPPAIADPGIIKGTIYRNFLPELTSEKAMQMAPKVGRYASTKGQDIDSIIVRAQQIRNNWDWVPRADIQRWFDVYETPGATLPPVLVSKYPFMQTDMGLLRKWLFKAYFDEADLGSKASYVQNYLPHEFKNPNAASTFYNNLLAKSGPSSGGPTWFQKARYYDLINAAVNNGLELKTWNPVDMVTNRLMAGADMRAKMGLLNELHQAGVATPVTRAPGFLTNAVRTQFPWKQVDAPNGTRWLLAPDVQALWQNGVESRGLWADPGIVGRSFRGWMGLKMAWVPLKLGASLFHPVHVMGINLVNNIGRAVGETFGPGQQGALRRVTALPEALLQSAIDPILAFRIGTPYIGKTARQSWQQIASTWGPDQKHYMDIFHDAGVSPQLAEQMRFQGRRNLQQAIVNMFGPDRTPGQRALGAAGFPVAFAQRIMQEISSPFFEHWIPNLKAAALIRSSEALFRERPDIMNDPQKRNIALNALGKQTDNRFGEMFYNGLFWNRTIKDAAIGSMLSLGWNLGFARDFVGGALNPVAHRLMATPNPTRALIRDVTNKTTNMFLYGMMAMTLNGIMNKMFTGQNPQGLDYLLPRIGGTNPDGTDRRLSTPHYTREIPMAEKHIEDQGGNIVYGLADMLWNKMMIEPFAEAIKNRDYYGGEIWNPDDPVYKQTWQFLSHMAGDQVSPMSISGAKRALQLSGKPTDWRSMAQAAASGDKDIWLPFLGYGPAPAYASRDKWQNRIEALGRQYVYPAEKPFQESQQFQQRLDATTRYKQAVKAGDQEKAAEAAKEMQSLGMTRTQIRGQKPGPSAEKTFQRLPASIQSRLLRDMPQDVFKVYFPHASKATKADPVIRNLQQEYQQ